MTLTDQEIHDLTTLLDSLGGPPDAVLVTGSRASRWGNYLPVMRNAVDAAFALVAKAAPDGLTLIVGDANGVDETCIDLRRSNWQLSGPHVADWDHCGNNCPNDGGEHRKKRRDGTSYCPIAGRRRNWRMAGIARGFQRPICLGFQTPLSKGTQHCLALARKADIPTWVWSRCTAEWHDTMSAYRYGCRCPKAREATRLYNKRLRQGRPEQRLLDCTGTSRRLKALAANGWRWTDLAQRLGCSWQYVQHLARGYHPKVRPDTYAKVKALFDQLRDTPGPSPTAAGQARARGYLPPNWYFGDDELDDPTFDPLAAGPEPKDYVDEVLVERVLAGRADRSQLPRTRAYKEAAVRIGLKRGMSLNAIALAIGTKTSTIRAIANPTSEEVGDPCSSSRPVTLLAS